MYMPVIDLEETIESWVETAGHTKKVDEDMIEEMLDLVSTNDYLQEMVYDVVANLCEDYLLDCDDDFEWHSLNFNSRKIGDNLATRN